MQFILKARAFLLEFVHYRLHQGLWHPVILSSALDTKVVPAEALFVLDN